MTNYGTLIDNRSHPAPRVRSSATTFTKAQSTFFRNRRICVSRDSSTNVVIKYAVDSAVLGDNAGTVRVEVQEDRGAVWMEVRWDAVYGGVTNTVTIPGFWINRDTRWRVRLEVGE